MKKVLGVAFCSLLAGAITAQQITVGASAPVVGGVSALAGSTSSGVTIPVGPVAPGTVAATGSFQSSASTAWGATPFDANAAAGFTVRAHAATAWSQQLAFGFASMTLDVHLDNGGSGPLTGVLRLRKVLGNYTGRSSASVDVGADGTPELDGFDDAVLVTIDEPGGAVDVRVVVQANAGSLSGQSSSQIGAVDVYCDFFPGQVVVDRFDSFWTVVRLNATPLGDDRWQLATTAPSTLNLQPFATVFGLQPTNVPIANGLTQLVSLDAWLPGTSLVFDLPPLPPGFALYAQGVVIAPDGTLLSSNSVRALWF